MNRCAVRQHSGVSRNVCAQTAMRSTLMVQKSYNGRMNMTSNRMNVDVKVQAVAGHGVSSSSQSVLAAAPVNPSIRIKLKSYWVDLLQDTVDKITDVAVNTGATIAGPVPLPTRRRVYTVLRSPHVNKKSREQFEVRTHQRLIDIKDLSTQTIDRLMELDLPAGVDIEVKL